MKIAVIGETRMPVLPYGAGGLGRATHDIADALYRRGRKVTLYATSGSAFNGTIKDPDAIYFRGDWDVCLDYSHDHAVSRNFPGEPVLNLIGDRECPYRPPNAIVESIYMQSHYPGARIVKAGLNIGSIPFTRTAGDYLVYMGLNVGHKQPDVAREVARRADKEIRMIGTGFSEVDEEEKWRILGGALGLLCSYTIDASPRSPIEAAACGTPTICLDGDGTKDHVVNGMTGFVCNSIDQMVDAVAELPKLSREKCRIWASQTHDIETNIIEIENLLFEVEAGHRW